MILALGLLLPNLGAFESVIYLCSGDVRMLCLSSATKDANL